MKVENFKNFFRKDFRRKRKCQKETSGRDDLSENFGQKHESLEM